MQNQPQVLVVDDDKAIREILVQLTLETIPEAHISAVHNGREALADLKIHGADLVITNFCMPVMDGPQLVRELRAREVATPIIMVSGNPDAQAQGEAAGITRFVAKTEVFSVLPSAILSLLEAA